MSTLPTLPAEHAGRVEVRLDSVRGRCLYACRSYSPLETITSETLHTFALSPGGLHTHCAGCAKALPSSRKRCSACRIVRYCDLSCQRWHWPLHKLECKALLLFWSTAAREGEQVTSHDTSRLVWISRLLTAHRHIDDAHNAGELAAVLQEMRTTLMLVRSLSTAAQPRLQSTQEPLPEAGRQMLANHVMTLMAGRNRTATPAERAQVDEWNRRLGTNTFNLEDDAGLGLAAVISLANHSCEPNAVHVPHGRHLVLGARQAVAAGDELTISYLSTDEQAWPVEARRKKLLNDYNFECQCSRCMRESAAAQGKTVVKHALS